MIKPDWNTFKTKFSENPQENFEWLSYLLFCQEYKKPMGVFGYFNQRNIETNPIQVDKQVIGWQAKFYDTTLSKNKTKIINLIKGSKQDFPALTKIIFYTNQVWGQGKKQNEPQTKIGIDQFAKSIGVEIDWNHTGNFFKSPFVSSENKAIAKHFFSLDKSVFDLLAEQKKHSERLLKDIHFNIKFGNYIIEIDRGDIVEKLNNSDQVVILSGVGGVGKTAVIKKYFEQFKKKGSIYLFKASEFELRSAIEFFNGYNIDEFIEAHEKEEYKTIVIDSAEKLLDLRNTDPFKEFLSALIESKWKLVFTTRINYLEELNYQFFEIYEITPLNLKITNTEQDKLEDLSNQFNFDLPADRKLVELIKNPFYLNEYLKFYGKSEKIDYVNFKNKLWNKVIKKSKPSREQCFLKIAIQRAEEGQFFINPDCESSILDEELVKDGLLGYEMAGYFITHDIYEEWALERNIQIKYAKRVNTSRFLRELGSSLPVRRSFRNWISEKLMLEDVEIKDFIEGVLSNDEIDSFWKDEVLVSALLSNYSERLFTFLKSKLLENDYDLLKKITFLLRIACKEIDEDLFKLLGVQKVDLFSLEYVYTKPKGLGWNSLIKFVSENLNIIGVNNIGFIFPILFDWNNKFKTGETTRFASLIALKYYQYIIEEDVFFSEDKFKKQLMQTIVYGCKEIKNELIEIIEKVVTTSWKYHRNPYYELSKTILTQIYGFAVATELPDEVIKLAKLFWVYTERQSQFNFHAEIDVDQYFGLENDQLRYFPASAFQTPTFWLLKSSLQKTIDFIIEFTNNAAESYSKSKLDNVVGEIELHITEDRSVKQYISDRLWCTFRGTQVSSDLLESMHMALEKLFLEFGKHTKSKVLENWLVYLLENSKSASITALVTSIVLAFPEKTFNVAKILFKTKELFKYDSTRTMLDQKALAPLGADENGQLYQNERVESRKLKHRTWSLENLMVNYQFFRSEKTDEQEAKKRQNIIWKIIDNYIAQLPPTNKENYSDKVWRTFLTRVDKRKMKPTFKETEEGFEIHLNPEMEPQLEKYNEQKLEELSTKHKYSPLKLWANYKFRYDEKFKDYNQYESSPHIALKEVKEILKALNENKDGYFHLFNDSIPAEVCSVLIRDRFDEIDKKDKVFCKDIVLEVAALTLNKEYSFQVSDGTESAISVLPILLKEFPDDRVIAKLILFANLFKPSGTNMSGMDINSFAIQATYKLWESNDDDAQSILFGYLSLAPKYELFYEEQKQQALRSGAYRIRENDVLNKFISQNEVVLEAILSVNSSEYDLDRVFETKLDILNLAFQLIPPNTLDARHKEFIKRVAIKFAEALLQWKGDDKVKYRTRNGFFKKLVLFVLNSPIDQIEDVLSPFLDKFGHYEAIADLMQEFISAEDKINSYQKFWKVWRLFEPKVLALCADGDGHYYTEMIVKSYLFGMNHWKDTAKDWRSFKPDDYIFFKKISKELGHCPSVLYAISKLLNNIGSPYQNEGISWISNMLGENPNLGETKQNENTIYYLEKLIRKYVHENRNQIRVKVKMKKELLIIFNYLIDKGSVIGYLLRESIL